MSNKVIIIIISMILLMNCNDYKAEDPVQNKTVPDFRLEDMNHKRFYLNQYKGKLVVIVFWATWCKACKKYLNALEKLNPEFEEKDIELVSIVIDPENNDRLKDLLNTSVKVSYPILLDRKKTVKEKFKIKEIPTTLIIGKKSNIVMKKEGYNLSTIAQIQNKLNQLLVNEK